MGDDTKDDTPIDPERDSKTVLWRLGVRVLAVLIAVGVASVVRALLGYPEGGFPWVSVSGAVAAVVSVLVLQRMGRARRR